MSKNLAAIRWAHATNSRDLLRIALENSELIQHMKYNVQWVQKENNYLIATDDIDAIEADVTIGVLTTDPVNHNDIPVMGHPPITSSDISLEQFLMNIKEHNAKNPAFAKIVKLDFKSIEIVTKTVNLLEKDWKDEYVCEVFLSN